MKYLARITGIAAILGLTACTTAIQVDADSSYQPQYNAETRELGKLKVDNLTPAPLQYYRVARLNAAPEKVFALVANHANVGDWIPGIDSVSDVNHSKSMTPGKPNKGTTRTIVDATGQALTEDITYWEKDVGYSYSIQETPAAPLTKHLGVIQIESDGNGGSLLTYRQYFEAKDSIKGKLTPFIMKILLNKALGNLTDEFGGELL